MKKHCVYSASAGLEVSLGKVPTKKGSEYLRGAIYMRAFPIEKGGREKQIVVQLQPQEAFRIALVIKRVLQTKKNEPGIAPHVFENNGNSTTTTLMCEAWEREGKGGFAIRITRKGQATSSVNIPMGQVDFMFLGRFLDALSVDACIEERQDETVQEPTNGSGSGKKNGEPKPGDPAPSMNAGDGFPMQDFSFEDVPF